ncbi:unnamed protein product [Gongylonema pulchrum]|uniref:Secreted protein n=1 Tax=Gongylonema pulchrum TaxID=637853 RepID=A0A183DM07_9BILA|nr:unnamed protein product [Gongylonema pulchrum]VDK76919.1 unnamed protein product [Gongylonema pulchrum]
MLISVITIVAAAISAAMAVQAMATIRFVAPCYVQPFISTTSDEKSMRLLNCCGPYSNITKGNPDLCSISISH